MTCFRWLLLALCLAVAGPGAARAQIPGLPAAKPAPAAHPASPPVTAAQAQQLLDVLNDPAKRAAFTATLETLVKAVPAAKSAAKPVLPLAPNSLGARVLVSMSAFLTHTSQQIVTAAGAVQSLPALGRWTERLASNPEERENLVEATWRLAAVMIAGLAVEWAASRAIVRQQDALARSAPHSRPAPETPATEPVELDELSDEPEDTLADDTDPAPPGAAPGQPPALMPPRRRRRVSPWTMLKRIPFVLGRLLLDLFPVLAFVAVSHLLTGTTLGGGPRIRLVLLAVLDAYAITRTIMCIARMLFSPGVGRLRLIHMSDKSAAYCVRWTRRLVIVAVFGYAVTEVGLLFGLDTVAHDALLKAIMLIDHVFLGVMVLEMRRAVARWIRAPRDAHGATAALRNWLAGIWHWVALFYIAALWIVWAVEIRDGYSRMLHTFLVTAAVLVAARFVLILLQGSVDRTLRLRPDTAERYPGLDRRLHAYHPVLRASVSALVGVLCILALLQVWGLDVLGWVFSDTLGHQIVSAVLTISVTLALALAVWEAANTGVERHLDRLARQEQLQRSARLRTLLPMLRTTLLVAILIVVGLMVLSEVGVNTAPLLAGAGVLGIAVGFGSQKLVQDVITGLFLLLENTMQVGDIVSLGGLSGVVENLSIRAIRLRAEDGSLHVIPFSAVTTVTNMSRDFAHAVIVAQVAYKDDYDEVIAVMQEIVKEMRAEPRWATEITDDMEVWGLDSFGASSVNIKCRIKCGPFGRWAVGREFNRRMKLRFDENGIEIPFPHQKLIFDAADVGRAIGGRDAAPAPAAPISPEERQSVDAKDKAARDEAARQAAE